MVLSLFNFKKPIIWFLFHLLLGIVSAISPFPLIIYFYIFFLFSIPMMFTFQNVNINLSYIIVYLTSFELIARMAKTSPYLPYELGKYLMMILLILGIFNGSNKGTLGLILVLLLLPALFYDFSGLVTNVDIRFNLLGSFNIGLAIMYFYKQKFNEIGIKTILILLTLPLISVLSYTIFKTPDLDSIEFSLTANFDTAGGFGSNQVSTVLGLGMMLSFYCWINQISITGNKFLDIIVVVLFSFQGLLTFSRGGIIGGIIGIIIVLFFHSLTNAKAHYNIKFKKIRRFFVPVMALLLIVFLVANSLTDGLLLLRYKGETQGTLLGQKEKNLNTLTTNRYNIFLSDLELFEKHGIFGVGAGASKFLREELNGVVSHVEMSRLIAEHGILGIIFNIMILIMLISFLKLPKTYYYKGLLFAFFIVGWYTSFHAATRTFITPLLMGLSTIYIVNEKSTVSRK